MNRKLMSMAIVIFCLLASQRTNAQFLADTALKASEGPSFKSLAVIAKLHPVMVAASNDTGVFTGHNAGNSVYFNMEEVKSVCPYLIKTEVKNMRWGKNNYKTVTVESIDMQRLALLLFSAIQELQQIVKPGYSAL